MLQALNNSFFDDFEILLGQANTLKENIQDCYNLGKINVIKAAPEKALAVADFAWVGSGTSTLEAVLLNVPFVLVYKTSAFSWRLMKTSHQIIIGLTLVILALFFVSIPVAATSLGAAMGLMIPPRPRRARVIIKNDS
mgnify:CR=1 FL=1